MAAIRLEQLQHALIARAGGALERVADRERQVVVADGDRIRVAQRRHGDLGRSPRADAGKRQHPLIGARAVHGHGFFEALRAPRRPDDHVGTPALDPEAVKGPVRRAGEDLRRRRKLQRERPWRGLAERVHEVPVRVDRFLRRDLLKDDRRHERFEDRMGPRHADAANLAVEPGDKRVDGDKARVVVLLAAQRGSLLDGPICAGTPRLHIDETKVMLDVHRGGARGSSRGAPYGIALVAQPWARPQRRERQRQIEGAAQLKPRLGIRYHADEVSGFGAAPPALRATCGPSPLRTRGRAY